MLETAKVIRVGFLQQNAFHKDDTFVPMSKQLLMMRVILRLYHAAADALKRGTAVADILGTGLFDKLIKMKYDIPNDKPEMFDEYSREIDEKLGSAEN